MPDSCSRKTSSTDRIAPGTINDAGVLRHPNDVVSLSTLLLLRLLLMNLGHTDKSEIVLRKGTLIPHLWYGKRHSQTRQNDSILQTLVVY